MDYEDAINQGDYEVRTVDGMRVAVKKRVRSLVGDDGNKTMKRQKLAQDGPSDVAHKEMGQAKAWKQENLKEKLHHMAWDVHSLHTRGPHMTEMVKDLLSAIESSHPSPTNPHEKNQQLNHRLRSMVVAPHSMPSSMERASKLQSLRSEAAAWAELKRSKDDIATVVVVDNGKCSPEDPFCEEQGHVSQALTDMRDILSIEEKKLIGLKGKITATASQARRASTKLLETHQKEFESLLPNQTPQEMFKTLLRLK